MSKNSTPLAQNMGGHGKNQKFKGIDAVAAHLK